MSIDFHLCEPFLLLSTPLYIIPSQAFCFDTHSQNPFPNLSNPIYVLFYTTHLEQQMDVSEDGSKKEFFVCLLLSKTSPKFCSKTFVLY